MQFHVVDTASALDELVARLHSARVISIDTETTSTDPMRAELVGISLAVDAETGYYIPVGHEAPPGSQLSLAAIAQGLGRPLARSKNPQGRAQLEIRSHRAGPPWAAGHPAGV